MCIVSGPLCNVVGNLGLEDVRVALGWVQQNIGDFGLFSFLEFSFTILFSRRRPKKGYVGRSWTRSDYRPPSCSQPHNIRSPGFLASHPHIRNSPSGLFSKMILLSGSALCEGSLSSPTLSYSSSSSLNSPYSSSSYSSSSTSTR